jgi:hypothetical protein
MGEERRITDLTEISAFRANDYIAVDNASEAQTKKLPATAITNSISAAQTDATRALNIARSTSSFPTGDAYSSSSAYKVGDMVIYNNTLYRCKTACSAASWSVNANNFEATSLASAITDVNNYFSNLVIIENRSIAISNGLASLGIKAGYKPIYVGTQDSITTPGYSYDTIAIGHSGGGNYFVRAINSSGATITNPNYAITIVWIKTS